MSEYFTFAGVPFLAVLPNNDETPHWKPRLEFTDRPLMGTDRFERSIRSRMWLLELDLWVEPSDTAQTSFASLQSAYTLGTVGDLVFPGAPAPDPVSALLVSFDVSPQRGGIDGYRGKVVFGQPGGPT